jgi:hypothetical protein
MQDYFRLVLRNYKVGLCTGGDMANESDDTFYGPEAIKTSVLLICDCEKSDGEWMKVVKATGESGLSTNRVMVLAYECKGCKRRVKVHFVVEAPKPA